MFSLFLLEYIAKLCMYMKNYLFNLLLGEILDPSHFDGTCPGDLNNHTNDAKPEEIVTCCCWAGCCWDRCGGINDNWWDLEKCMNKFQVHAPDSAWIYNLKHKWFEARNFGKSKQENI